MRNWKTAEGEKLEIPTPYSYLKFKIETNLLNDWHETWDDYDSESGRRTRDFVPKVNRKFFLSKYLIFFLSGHGPFPYYLNRFKKLNSSSCPCGSIGDVDHYVFRCQYTTDFHLKEPIAAHRQAWFKNVQENNRVPLEIEKKIVRPLVQGLSHWDSFFLLRSSLLSIAYFILSSCPAGSVVFFGPLRGK
ncbi:hypothetical protein AVEN_119932-1 [Araneus ventricosus]|uniref:Reverse transcriptase zinc-binding domain-containing protein n=1 Tax=Araneus ventricosus TaxID=182803 RepID=A0A4Y2I228_ARAVE|nr:hypothetical protein AVEN_119932-1 [Araneus ventricosus]